ncbi:uncharacterized protein LOC103702598 isoform X2 [Phoenix dactylifera]|uniref:Uncharacterized protein LOC103702598 isoform X2 n=1 Tax=Phoenix dactylifera TaxID=42345 RepID=A0A8B7MT30_PHODC|nr:uncharacterized protein LOC103702598 isoform X2 [Phoenix dactylifera]
MVLRPPDRGGVGDVVKPAEVHAANDRRDSPRDLRGRDSPRNLRRLDSPLDPRPRDSPQDLRRRDSPRNLRRLDSPLDPRPRDSPQDLRRRDSPRNLRRLDSPLDPRPRDSPQDLRRRDSPRNLCFPDSPPPFHRRRSLADFRRRGSPAGFHPRYQRFGSGSISPSRWQRLDDGHYDPEFDGPLGPRFGHGLQGERFRDASPPYGPGRGGRPFGRHYNASGQGFPPFEGEYVHRNDLNFSPREGDWICQNPSCGNLNFARPTYCNNCNKYRYEPQLHGHGRSPRRGYFNSPSPCESPPRIFGPPMDRGLRRDLGRHRSPPHGWGMDGPRDSGFGSPPAGRVGRFADHMHRERFDYHYELDYRGRGKFDWPVLDEQDRRDRGRDGFVPNRRGYDRCPPLPRGWWWYDSMERSRSPIGNRPLKKSYMALDCDDRHFDDSYMGQGQTDDLDLHRGRGYRRGGNSFAGPGQGDRWGIARGRNDDVY